MYRKQRKNNLMLPFATKRRQHKDAANKSIGFKIWLLLALFLSLTTTLSVSFPVKPAAADADFVEVLRRVGRYGMIANGVGTRGNPQTGAWTGVGDIVLDIPATATIEMARIIWTGRSSAYDGDGVQLARDTVPLGTINATIQYEQNPWCCAAQQRHESADITAFILPGNHTYTVSDHNHGAAPVANNLNYGVGIWVVYQDASEPIGETVIYQGQDSFFRSWDPERGPHTEVRCATFLSDSVDRVADVIHLVSGVDTWDNSNGVFYLRGVAFWLETGNGPIPPPDEVAGPAVQRLPALSQRPNAIGHVPGGQFPIQSYAGLEWDNFSLVNGINVPAADTWTCFQVESGDFSNLSGLDPNPDPAVGPLQASGMWNLFAIRVYVEPPLPVELISFRVKSTTEFTVAVRWDTAAEVNNFGFNLYRATTNQFADAELIHFEPSSSTADSGASYSFDDTVPGYGQYWYWLEDIDTEGNVQTRHGPLSVSVSKIRTQFLPMIVFTP
jgi:hypothetical protein